jgi:Spy/CpxP family protein refolding chaperone
MNMSNRNRMKLLGIAVASAIGLASVAVAQHQGRTRGGGHGLHPEGMGPMGPRGPMGPGSQLRMLRELDLSDDQRQQIRALFEEVEASGVPERLRQTRESLHQAIESGADEATLRQQASQLGEVEGDAAVEWARVRARIQEILTAEQEKELEQLKQEAEERMEVVRRQREERRARRGKSGADLL